LKELKDILDEKFYLRDKVLSKTTRRFISEFTTILFSEGKEDFYKEIIELFPDILNRENQIMIELYELEKSEDENKIERLEEIREKIERIFNNTPNKVKEVILFLFYSVYIRSAEDNLEILEKLLKELEEKIKKFKTLNILSAKIHILKNEKEKAKEILDKLKEKAIIEGDKNLIRLIDEFKSSELD
jgi:tetratricopeptide (TPR) repeat protein